MRSCGRFFLCNFMLHLYLAVDKCSHLLSLQAIVDIVTVPPAYAVLFINVRHFFCVLSLRSSSYHQCREEGKRIRNGYHL